MNNQSDLSRSPPGTRQQPLLREKSESNRKQRFAEAAGGTAAGCAAICCCCPFTVMNLLILTIYKVPVGIYRKVWDKQRGKGRPIAKKNEAATAAAMATADGGGIEWAIKREQDRGGEPSVPPSYLSSEDMELEEEMWDRFNGTGFWRTPSQRET